VIAAPPSRFQSVAGGRGRTPDGGNASSQAIVQAGAHRHYHAAMVTIRDTTADDYDAYVRLFPELAVDDPIPSRARFAA
jgi:hypothetical protein